MAASSALRIVFMGTPEFACPAFKALNQRFCVELAVTRPDAVRSRGKRAQASPVAKLAEELNIACVKAKRIDSELMERIKAIEPDIICVVAYGALLPDELIKSARLVCINIHGSLLPRWRGAAPFQRAILAGDAEIGISIMQVTHELDAGDYAFQAALPVVDRTFPELTHDLSELAAEQLVSAIEAIASGTIVWQKQDSALVTYADKVSKAEFLLSPQLSASENQRRVQASSRAYPARFKLMSRNGAYEREVRAVRSCVAAGVHVFPSEVMRTKHQLYLGCGDATLELVELQPTGKSVMSAAAFVQSLPQDGLTWSSII